MSNNDDLAFTSTTELRALIASGQVSPVEVTELYLAASTGSTRGSTPT